MTGIVATKNHLAKRQTGNSYNGIRPASTKERDHRHTNSLHEFQNHYVEQKKTDIEEHRPYDSIDVML